MIDPIRRALTQLGGLAAHPLAFLLVVTYGLLWFVFDREGFGWHGLATMAVWFMTLFIQRAEHRDTQAIQAKLDELIHAQSRASNAMTRIDEAEPEDIERHRKQARKEDQLRARRASGPGAGLQKGKPAGKRMQGHMTEPSRGKKKKEIEKKVNCWLRFCRNTRIGSLAETLSVPILPSALTIGITIRVGCRAPSNRRGCRDEREPVSDNRNPLVLGGGGGDHRHPRGFPDRRASARRRRAEADHRLPRYRPVSSLALAGALVWSAMAWAVSSWAEWPTG